MIDKRGYEFSFAWLFAILVGMFIIFIAVFAATRFVDTSRFQTESERGQQIGILLNPIETNLAQAKFAKISVREETRIFNSCSNSGTFGSQGISTSIKSGIGGKEWREEPGATSSFRNKYLFSDSVVQGEREFYVISKPFKLPFKIADLMIMWSDLETYCFVNPIPEIREEIRDLNTDGIFIVDSIGSCPEGSKSVCFSGGPCDISVVSSGTQKKVYYNDLGREVEYIESIDSNDRFALMYAAIFSNPDNYECQIKRLAGRSAEIARLLSSKSEYLEFRDCGSASLRPELLSYSATAGTIVESGTSLGPLENSARELRRKNAPLICKLF
jgi:hypothetical protein